MEQRDERFVQHTQHQKNFFTKTKYLMYVLVFFSAILAVFFYIISVGQKIFVVSILLLMAMMGAYIAVDARRKEAELDAFALYYGIKKLENEKEKI
jgi:4-hydroxybenzoate polyprenyltransferase